MTNNGKHSQKALGNPVGQRHCHWSSKPKESKFYHPNPRQREGENSI